MRFLRLSPFHTVAGSWIAGLWRVACVPNVPEVRLFFQKLFDENDGAFFWIDPDSYMLLFWGLMLLSPYRCDGKVGLQPEDMLKYLYWGYYKLNVFCQKNKLSPDFSTKAIGDAVKHFDFEFCISS